MKILYFSVIAVMAIIFNNVYASKIDWNSSQLQWHGYDSGLKELKRKNQVGIIILYTDWCSVCKEYSNIFKKPEVVSALKGITLIKANAETEEKVKRLKEYDQKYVPKTIVIDKLGNIVPGIFGEKDDFMFFLPSDDPVTLLELVDIVKGINSEK